MIKHVFTLMWNRKRANALIVLELSATFLVLFALIVLLAYNYRIYNTPLGFTVDNNWTISVSVESERGRAFFSDGQIPEDIFQVREEVMQVLRQMPEIKKLHTVSFGPYGGGNFSTIVFRDGEQFTSRFNLVSDGLPEAIGMELVEGRWFGPQDAGQDWRPIVINRGLKETIFGDKPAVGEEVTNPPNPNVPQNVKYKILGVFDDFRKDGEFSPSTNYLFERDPLTEPGAERNLFSTFNLVAITENVRPGDFEGTLHSTLRGIQSSTPINGVKVDSWARLQRQNFIQNVSPILVMTVVAGFIIMMVIFGLFGVLWQNVIRRTREIGVRRAMGATGSSVRRQLTAEMVVLALFALTLGFIVVVQLPLSGYFKILDWPLFWNSLIISAIALIGLSALCALYPSWLGTKVDTVDALRYE